MSERYTLVKANKYGRAIYVRLYGAVTKERFESERERARHRVEMLYGTPNMEDFWRYSDDEWEEVDEWEV